MSFCSRTKKVFVHKSLKICWKYCFWKGNSLKTGLNKRWFGPLNRCFLCSKNSGPDNFGLKKRLGLLTSGFIKRWPLYYPWRDVWICASALAIHAAKGCQDRQQLTTTTFGGVSWLPGAAFVASALARYHATSKLFYCLPRGHDVDVDGLPVPGPDDGQPKDDYAHHEVEKVEDGESDQQFGEGSCFAISGQSEHGKHISKAANQGDDQQKNSLHHKRVSIKVKHVFKDCWRNYF